MYTLTFIIVQLISYTNVITVNYSPYYITGENSFITIESLAQNVYTQINDPELNFEALNYALKGYYMLRTKNIINNDLILTIIDYSKPSDSRRLFVIDISEWKILYKSLVAHGKNSGIRYANSFSNKKSSYKSSIGFFLTDETYYGKHGFSLRLDGLEKGINDNARERAIVIHSAGYVNEEFIKEYGRLGRSHGCPALPLNNYKNIVNTIKDKTCLFIYYPDKKYIKDSEFVNTGGKILIN
ncbi:MAG: murein L,D-transpeptidase catalytic domain family protein [Bacteroidales bacterium]|nr:MAG: murein L,D-transpeptidase catalytic domain family protein [Bacteroidales bacterium]